MTTHSWMGFEGGARSPVPSQTMTACPATPVDKRSRLIATALSRILRPLVRILLRLGVPYQACAETLKSVYVDVAFKDFGIKGRKQTKSRVTVITGLSHVEVDRQMRSNEPAEPHSIRRWHRAGRVLTHWTEDPEFADADGNPAILPLEGGSQSFHDLVEKHSGGATVRAVLDELVRSNAVCLRENRVQLIKPSYLADTNHEDVEKLGLLGLATSDLLSTIEWNIRPNQASPRAQQTISLDHFPAALAPDACRYLSEKVNAFANEVDTHLSAMAQGYDLRPGEARIRRLGLGLYGFLEQSGLEQP